MRARLALAVTAVTGVLVCPAATGAPGCTVLTDPAGDVAVVDTAATVPDPHLDVRAVTVAVERNRLRAIFAVEGLMEERHGEWRMTFRGAGRELFVGAGIAMWVNIGDYRGTFGYVAGVSGRRHRQVSGEVDYTANLLVVDAPLSAFGGLDPSDELTDFRLVSKETFVNSAAGETRLIDVATGTGPHAVRDC